MRSRYNTATALALPIDYFLPETGSNVPVRVALEDITASDLREAELNGEIDQNPAGFLIARPQTPMVHAGSRSKISLRGGVEWARLTANAEEGAEFLEIKYAPGASSGPSLSHHPGREFGLVLEGQLVVELGFERYTLVEHRSGNPQFQQGYLRDIWEALWFLLIIVATGEYGDKEARTPSAAWSRSHSGCWAFCLLLSSRRPSPVR